jgi:hypothetical protein
MVLEILKEEFAVCKVENLDGVDLKKDYTFIAKTDEELSLVCPIEDVPENKLESDTSWKCFRVQGPLEFSLIGIIAGISKVLAENAIGLFVISTYNTDYVLIKSENMDSAKICLENAGYDFTK